MTAHYVLCRDCQRIFTVGIDHFQDMIRDTNNHILDYHRESLPGVIGELDFVDLDAKGLVSFLEMRLAI